MEVGLALRYEGWYGTYAVVFLQNTLIRSWVDPRSTRQTPPSDANASEHFFLHMMEAEEYKLYTKGRTLSSPSKEKGESR